MANWHLSNLSCCGDDAIHLQSDHSFVSKCPAFTPCTLALQWFEVDAMDGRGGLWGYQWKIAAMAFEAWLLHEFMGVILLLCTPMIYESPNGKLFGHPRTLGPGNSTAELRARPPKPFIEPAAKLLGRALEPSRTTFECAEEKSRQSRQSKAWRDIIIRIIVCISVWLLPWVCF